MPTITATDDALREETLVSPRRMELVFALGANGRSTAAELAQQTGMRPTAVYAHLKKLLAVGLVAEAGKVKTGRRDGTLYALRPGAAALRYRGDDPDSIDRVCRYARSVLRQAANEACAEFETGQARTRGRRRQTFVQQSRTWLSGPELEEANALLHQLYDLFSQARDPEGRRLYALTVALRPPPGAD